MTTSLASRHNIQGIVLLPYDDGAIGLHSTVMMIQDVFDYGRAIPRGLLVYQDVIWIVCQRRDRHWHLETKLHEVLEHRCGSDFTKWRNYLRRIHRWPWKDEDTKEILGEKHGPSNDQPA